MLTLTKSYADEQRPQTSGYYERNAGIYFERTHQEDLSALYEAFIRKLPENAHILDAGSGSGRDTVAFLQSGYSVSAFDASPALCELSSQHTRLQTRGLHFQELEDEEEYDGIWACASLLHVPKAELPNVMERLARALKPGGVLYMSFKYGTGDRLAKDGRLFSDMTESHLHRLIPSTADMKFDKTWKTNGEGKFRGQEKWLNALASKLLTEESHG